MFKNKKSILIVSLVSITDIAAYLYILTHSCLILEEFNLKSLLINVLILISSIVTVISPLVIAFQFMEYTKGKFLLISAISSLLISMYFYSDSLYLVKNGLYGYINAGEIISLLIGIHLLFALMIFIGAFKVNSKHLQQFYVKK